MKKIPTLFEREFKDHKVVKITDKVTPGLEWVMEGKGLATVKIDGSCCAIIQGEFYKRYDCKKGKKPPEGAIPCCDPDPVTGHWPHWVKCDRDNPADKWFWAAYDNSTLLGIVDATYEAIGAHFQGNPYDIEEDILVRHGFDLIDELNKGGPRTKEMIFNWLNTSSLIFFSFIFKPPSSFPKVL